MAPLASVAAAAWPPQAPQPCLQGPAFPKCFTPVSILPSDSCHGLHDRHHFQVHSGTNHHTLGKCVIWANGASLGYSGQDPSRSDYFIHAYVSGLSSPVLPLSVYGTKAVIIAMIITAVVSISVTVFCFQTKVRATGPLPSQPALFLIQTWPF